MLKVAVIWLELSNLELIEVGNQKFNNNSKRTHNRAYNSWI